MIKDPRKTAFLRLASTLLIVFLIWIVMGSAPIRSMTIDYTGVFRAGLTATFLGPVIPLYRLNEAAGTIGAGAFWLVLLGTAWQSRNKRARRWFLGLLVLFVLMNLVMLAGTIVMGLIAMAHA